MDVSAILKQAWQDVESAGLPEQLHDVAFREAVRLLSGQQGQTDTSQRGTASDTGASSKPKKIKIRKPTDSEGEASSLPTVQVNDAEFFAKVSEETEVEEELLEEVFYLDQGVPRISKPARLLGENAKAQMETVGQLIPVLHATGFGLPEVSTALVRDECRRLRFVDSNLNTYLADLDGISYVGPARDKRLRVRQQAMAPFKRIVTEIARPGAAADDAAK